MNDSLVVQLVASSLDGKSECSQDCGTPCLPVSHPKQLNSVYEVYNKICLVTAIVKVTRCTVFQIYFILEHTLHVSVSPSNIRGLRLYIQHQVCVIQVLWLLGSKQPQNLYGMMLYVQS
jgi:hypothetical protein